MNFLPVIFQLLEGAPAAIQAVEKAAADPAVREFIAVIESLFHISSPTQGAATVVEPKK